MKILSAEQIRACDSFTIQNEPVSSLDLMERAANACYERILKLVEPEKKLVVFCGKGNNGGDGLAIARMFLLTGFDVTTVIIHHSENFSPDAQVNYDRLLKLNRGAITEIKNEDELQTLPRFENAVIVDALLGTGINKPVSGLLAAVIDFINASFQQVISIDVPSGLLINGTKTEKAIRAALTLTFQVPKLGFLLPGNGEFVPEFEILDIGLMPRSLELVNTDHFYVTLADVAALLKPRHRFSHKGTYGHALLLAGSKGKSGAAVMSAAACLRSGPGLLTVHSTQDTVNALLNSYPEAMSSADAEKDFISEIPSPENYNAIGFGPGAGLHDETQKVLKKILQYYAGKLVIDADGLNILAENKTWLDFLPAGTILTPHPKEFERLTQKHNDDEDRLKALKHFSQRYNCIVILKGAFSAIAMPDGNTFFNSSGNPGLAKGGSGDLLTGILLGLMARGYSAPQSAIIGTFVHGFAADLLLEEKSVESILATDIINKLPTAFKKIETLNL